MPANENASVWQFASTRIPQILITLLLVVYSLARQKLTPLGVVAAATTAIIHMMHPSSLPFTLLVVFFMAGTVATRINHRHKATLTQSSAGGVGGEGARNSSQVIANSAAASTVIVLSVLAPNVVSPRLAITGVAANYAAAAADTLSSELGILSKSSPILITNPWRNVPRGTNGGVTVLGIGAGVLGGVVVAITVMMYGYSPVYAASFAYYGLAGTVLDSYLGAVAQASVEDKASGRIIEGENGRRVLVTTGGSRISRGNDWLNNNGVNFAMAASITVVAMLIDAINQRQ